MMGTTEDSPFVTKIFLINTSIVVLLFFLLAFTPIIYQAYRFDSPEVSFTQEINTGSTGQVVTKQSSAPTNVAYILNETPSPDSTSWKAHRYPHWPTLDKADTTMNEQGLVIDLESISYDLGTGVNVPLDDYDSLEFSASFSLLSGEASVNLYVDYNDFHGENLYYLNQFQEANLTSEDDSVQLSFNAPLSILNTEVSHWLVYAYIRVGASTTTSARVALHNVSVKATSTKDLFPLRIDVQSTNGSSLYDNLYFKWMSNPPRFNLTRHGMVDEWAIIYPKRPNDTLYLTPSNFSGYGGWRSTISQSGHCVPVSISLGYGDDAHWGVRLYSTRLYISTSPRLPAIELSVEEYYDESYDMFSFDSEVTNFVYVPLESDDNWFYISVESDHRHLFGFRRISEDGSWNGPLSSSYDYYLEIDFPIANFANLALSSSDTIYLILCILLGALIIARIAIHFKKLGPSIVLKDPRLAPVILLLVSAVLPWVVYTQSMLSFGPPFAASFARINPLATYLEFNNDSLVIIHPGFAAVSYHMNAVWLFIGAVVLFWLPLLYCSTSVGISEDKRYDSHFAVMLMLPIVLVLSSLLPGFSISSLNLGPGSYLALLALPLWLVFETINRKVFQQSE